MMNDYSIMVPNDNNDVEGKIYVGPPAPEGIGAVRGTAESAIPSANSAPFLNRPVFEETQTATTCTESDADSLNEARLQAERRYSKFVERSHRLFQPFVAPAWNRETVTVEGGERRSVLRRFKPLTGLRPAPVPVPERQHRKRACESGEGQRPASRQRGSGQSSVPAFPPGTLLVPDEDPKVLDTLAVYTINPQTADGLIGTASLLGKESKVALPSKLVDTAIVETAFKRRDYSLLLATYNKVIRTAREQKFTLRQQAAYGALATVVGFVPQTAELVATQHLDSVVGRQLIGRSKSYADGKSVDTVYGSPVSTPSVIDELKNTMMGSLFPSFLRKPSTAE